MMIILQGQVSADGANLKSRRRYGVRPFLLFNNLVKNYDP